MRKIGIVGGVGWRATADYYAGICRRSEEWQLSRDPEALPCMPEIAIESLDLRTAVSYLGRDEDEESWFQFDAYHRAALQRLETNGAQVAVIASNTPHLRFDSIVSDASIPVISIIDAVAKECARIGIGDVLILGTEPIMRSSRFPEAFKRYGLKARAPDDEVALAMTSDLIRELQRGQLHGVESAREVAAIVRKSVQDRNRLPTVCLACTELPLAFEGQELRETFEHDSVLYINSTAVHISAVFDVAVRT